MIRILELGPRTKRTEYYRTVNCDNCGASLVFKESDAWCDDPKNDIFRIECPVCRSKVHFHGVSIVTTQHAAIATKEEYDNAIKDTSKSGLQMLMDEKRKEDAANGK